MTPQDTSESVLVVGSLGGLDALRQRGFAPRRVETTDAVSSSVEATRPACLVVGAVDDDIPTITADLTTAFPTVPVVACPDGHDAAEASNAVAAGVDEYVPLTLPNSGERIVDAVERAIEAGRQRRCRREQADQFEAIFGDDNGYAWELDAEGAVVRANDTVVDAVRTGSESLVGAAFHDGPWWRDADRERIADAVSAALEGEFSTFEATIETAQEGRVTLDVRIHPVGADPTSLVVEATDVTERAELAAELRDSEELHRVTLNNMTDTVLMTDDDDEFTYVCPNVHFIFGYSAAEIRDMGTIDELLGDDLFDPEALDEQGVLTNIETTATDRAGEEHTLLVNVRRVSIQEGTTLFSCRDITKRKRREEALTALHSTTRRLLYAETRREIGQVLVDDAEAVLDLDASVAYLFDRDDDALQPVAASAEMRRLNGSLPTLLAGETSLAGKCFVEGEPAFFGDVHEAEALSNPTTGLRSGAFVPLGDHGVFVVGCDEADRFDAVTRELADLVGATAEAALDRVQREESLREQERERKRQNTRLTRLDRLNEVIRDVDQTLVQAETREEIEHAVCERLTDSDRFRFAWVGRQAVGDRVLDPRAWSGTGHGYLDSISLAPGGPEPAVRTAESRSVSVVENVVDGLHDDPWRKEALSREFQSVISVPLAYDEVSYGVLTVYADGSAAFDDTDRAVFAELGETIASAMSAVERKSALLTAGGTRLEFTVDDPGFVLARIARETDATLHFRGGVQQTDRGVSVFVSVEDVSPESVGTVATQFVGVLDVTVISDDGDDGGLLRVTLSRPFIALTLADHGAVLRSLTTDGVDTAVVVDLPENVGTRSVERLVSNAFSSVELAAKQSLDESSQRTLSSTFVDELTDRQLEVLQTAYYSGYFESPRDSSGEDVADALGVSPTAFYRHTRTVERKLFEVLFERPGTRTLRPEGVE